jgi:hypothetical protein
LSHPVFFWPNLFKKLAYWQATIHLENIEKGVKKRETAPKPKPGAKA